MALRRAPSKPISGLDDPREQMQRPTGLFRHLSLRAEPPDYRGTPGSRDDAAGFRTLKESFLRLVKGGRKKQLLWVVLRQDTFVPSDGYQQVRLDTFTGKTLRSMDSLKGCSVVPLATPHAAFKITLTKGKALVFQPESEDSVDTADWVSALQLATTMAAVNRTRLDELSGQARASSEQLKVAVSRTASKHSADFVPEEAVAPNDPETVPESEESIADDADTALDDLVLPPPVSETDLSLATDDVSFDETEDMKRTESPEQFGMDYTSRPHQSLSEAGYMGYVNYLQSQMKDLLRQYQSKLETLIAELQEAPSTVAWQQRLSHGRVEEADSALRKHVKLFLCSTFKDTKVERGFLLRQVLPQIQQMLARVDIHFSAVDMRWGFPEYANLDHEVATTCVDNVKECMSTSLGAGVLLFKTQRRGWGPLPASIEQTIFESVLVQCTSEEKAALDTIYKLNTNISPPTFTLAVELTEDQTARQLAMAELAAASAVLQQYAAWLMGDPVTLQEMKAALASNDPTMVVAVEREFVLPAELPVGPEATIHVYNDALQWGLPLDPSKQEEDGKPDPLDELSQLLADANVRPLEYKLTFHPHADFLHSSAFTDYVTEAMTQITRRLLRLVAVGIRRHPAIALPAWAQEALTHGKLAQKLAVSASSSATVLQALDDYVASTSIVPLVVVGSDKIAGSELLGRWLSRVTDVATDHSPIWLYRFLGATQHVLGGRCLAVEIDHQNRSILHKLDVASSVTLSLHSILQQLAYVRDPNYVDEVTSVTTQLLGTFIRHLGLAAEHGRKVVLVLAGLDEFCDEEDRLEERLGLFAWLHASLPGNVKVVLSVTQDGPALIQLKEELDQESFVFIPSMNVEQAIVQVDSHLDATGRSITSAQREALEQGLATAEIGVLYMRDLLQEVGRWDSFTTLTNVPTDAAGLFSQRLDDIELKHGAVLLSAIARYLNSARRGLTANELAEVLVADPAVKAAVFTHVDYPDGKFPVHVLLNIRRSLGFALHEDVDGAWQWSEATYFQVVNKRYPVSTESRMHVATVLQTLLDVLLQEDVPMITSAFWGSDTIISNQAFLGLSRSVDNVAWLLWQLEQHDALYLLLSRWQAFHCLTARAEHADELAKYFKATGRTFEELVVDYMVFLQAAEWTQELANFVWCDLARFVQQHERFDILLEPLRLAQAWFQANFGAHVSTAACSNMIGRCYLRMHQVEQARDEFQACVAMMRALEKPDLRMLAAFLNNLAIVYKRLHRYTLAHEILQQGESINMELNPGPDNVQQAGLHITMALNASYIGRVEEGVALLRQSLDCILRFEGSSLRTNRVLVNLAIMYDRNKDYATALSHAVSAIDELIAARGKEFPSTMRAMRVKARCLMHLDQHIAAKTLIQEVLSLMQSNTGISQADLDDTKVLAVEVLAPLGLVDEAKRLASEVADSMAKLTELDAFQKEANPKLDSLIYEAEGKLGLAIASQLEVIAILTTVLPGVSWYVMNARERLAMLEAKETLLATSTTPHLEMTAEVRDNSIEVAEASEA